MARIFRQSSRRSGGSSKEHGICCAYRQGCAYHLQEVGSLCAKVTSCYSQKNGSKNTFRVRAPPRYPVTLRTIGQFWTVSFSLQTKVSQTLQSVLCITTNKYLVRVLVVLLHARFSVVSPIPFLLAAIFFPVHPYIGSTTVLPNSW